MAPSSKASGLAGVVAGETAISAVDREGLDLTYRGYSIRDLASQATFEEVVYLLLYEKLPTEEELRFFCQDLVRQRGLPPEVCQILERLPGSANPMDILRTGCSALGAFEPERDPERDQWKVAKRLVACFPSILLYWHRFHRDGQRIETATGEPRTAAHFLSLLRGEREISPLEVRALDVSLILYAEHEFNASTFTCRTIASTLSDFYSAVTGGIGALRGPLHGGANEAAMELILRFKTPDEAEEGICQMLQRKELVMGFGHRVYKKGDPRSRVLKEWAQKLAELRADQRLFPICERIEKVMFREKQLYPNVDFYGALTYYFLGIPIPMFTPLFVIARVAGWSAHIMEQRAHNRLIRPMGEYVGPSPRPYVPMHARS
ncbi:citrate/2-methylcitrate synthase [Candidatus Methylacidithermus pantelleriae]|nr:citrate/2-methylcitrate synthase [Candidatus Methylacidithermus pantelleriae]